MRPVSLLDPAPHPTQPDTPVITPCSQIAFPASPPWVTTIYEYPRGAVLFLQGQKLQEVLQVVRGMVKLTQVDACGLESIVGLAVPGQWLGAAVVIADRPAPVSAVTCADVTLARMPAKDFAMLLRANPELSTEIHRAHARELCGQLGRIGEMCRLGALQRLEGALHRFARSVGVQREGHAVELTLPIHRWELAEFIGVTPEHLSRLLRAMEKKGLIARARSHIVIRDSRRMLAA